LKIGYYKKQKEYDELIIENNTLYSKIDMEIKRNEKIEKNPNSNRNNKKGIYFN